jgi:hypothetical protein
MTFHVSIGLVILILIVLRFAWRLTHPVAPENSLPVWQHVTSERDWRWQVLDDELLPCRPRQNSFRAN